MPGSVSTSHVPLVGGAGSKHREAASTRPGFLRDMRNPHVGNCLASIAALNTFWARISSSDKRS